MLHGEWVLNGNHVLKKLQDPQTTFGLEMFFWDQKPEDAL